MKSKEVIELVVQKCGTKTGDKYRLGINTADSSNKFRTRGALVSITLDCSIVIETKTTCGPPKNPVKNKKHKKGFDLYDKRISEWIVKKCFHCYERRKPTRIQFRYSKDDEKHYLIFNKVFPINIECKESLNKISNYERIQK